MDKSADRIVKRFDYNRLVRQTTMPIITIFNSPTGYPGKYVARVFDVGKPTNLAAVAGTYEDLLEAIPTRQMVRLERNPNDDPVIVETWV